MGLKAEMLVGFIAKTLVRKCLVTFKAKIYGGIQIENLWSDSKNKIYGWIQSNKFGGIQHGNTW